MVNKLIKEDTKMFLTGNEVLAYAANSAEAEFMYGYPITPQTEIAAYMESVVKKDEMLFFLLTNILTESSDLVFVGEGAKELAEAAFGTAEENWVHVPGMVSRKKQFVPSVLSALQQ